MKHHLLSTASRFLALFVIALWLQTTVAYGEDPPADQSGQQPTLTLDQVQQRFQALRQRPGPLTLTDYISEVADAKGQPRLPVPDVRKSWTIYSNLLKPPITKADFRAYQEALREALVDVKVVYNYRSTRIAVDGKPFDTTTRCVFASADGRLLKAEQWKEPSGMEFKRVISYDGDAAISYISTNKPNSNATIEHFNGRSQYYEVDYNPLMLTMLLNTQTTILGPSIFHDMNTYLDQEPTAVLEERQEADGLNCIVIGQPDMTALFSETRGYCLMKLTVLGRGRRPLVVRTLTGHQDYGNGIWLPTRIVNETWHNDKPQRVEIDIETWEVNKGIPKEYFSDVIPRGAMVLDQIRGVSYVARQGSSIEDLLNNAVSGKRPWRLRTIMLVANIICGCLCVALWALWQRRTTPEAPKAGA